MRMYILGKEIELNDGNVIAQTKQVNDIVSLNTRQTNYTNSFSIPKTAKNIRTFNYLSLVGNDSNVPYQKNDAYLYSDTGECFVYKGWAVVTETSKDYKVHIYDGNLELYKIIENKSLSDLDLTALSHAKTPANVVGTWDNTRPYKYILADYNGKAVYSTNKINIDYLVPSVRVSYLINQIKLFSGYEFQGSVFTNPDFLNLYLTYPKGSESASVDVKIFEQFTVAVDMYAFGGNLVEANSKADLSSGTILSNTDVVLVNQYKLKILTQQVLTIELAGAIAGRFNDPNGENSFDIPGVYFITFEGATSIRDSLGTDGQLIYNVTVNAGATLEVNFEFDNPNLENIDSLNAQLLYLKISKNSLGTIDFLDELNGFSIKDFFNEIIWQFGLTLYKDKYEKIYYFKTIAEITNSDTAIDWSNKFLSKDNEKYIFGSYAQNNSLKYKYNEQEANYNDGVINVNNKNLDDERTAIQSQTYTPELEPSNNLGFSSKIYKLWDKEIKDNGDVNYKALQNQFYFIRSLDVTGPSRIIGSEALNSEQTFTTAPVESYNGLPFQDVVNKYYLDIQKLLDKSRIETVSLWLKDLDVVDFDFSKLYYFEQLSGYYIVNKIVNFIPGRKTKVEIIRVNNPIKI